MKSTVQIQASLNKHLKDWHELQTFNLLTCRRYIYSDVTYSITAPQIEAFKDEHNWVLVLFLCVFIVIFTEQNLF